MVCMDHCDSFEKCKNNPQTLANCPKFTEQTMYILRYLTQQSQLGTTIYPYPGTWQDQPEWYLLAYSIAKNALNTIRNNKK